MSKPNLLARMFGRKKPGRASATVAENSGIESVMAGDVLAVRGVALAYDDTLLIVEHRHRYVGNNQEWWELVATDRDRRMRLEWWGQGADRQITASTDFDPVGLDALGLTEDHLVELDEEHSLDNAIQVRGRLWHYRNSHEAFFHRDNAALGEGFYMWDLISDDGLVVMAVAKFEGSPFEVHFARVISPDDVEVYPGHGHDTAAGND